MKKNGNILFIFLLFGIILFLPTMNVNAGRNVLKDDTEYIDAYEDDTIVDFTYDGMSIIYFYAESSAMDTNVDIEKNDLRISLKDTGTEANRLNKEIAKIYTYDGQWAYLCADNTVLKKEHKYEFCVSSYTDEKYYIDYKLYKYSEYSTSIAIPKKKNIKTDSYQKITVSSVNPGGSFPGIVWSSSNTKVATVNSGGYITGKKPGSCTITAKLQNGRIFKCSVTVVNPKAFIKYKKCTMYAGTTTKNSVIYASKRIQWKSNNTKIATVSKNGSIKAKKVGSCTVTAKMGNKGYKCQVKVIYRSPNFNFELTEYNTRNNYFKGKIKNFSDKPVTIYNNSLVAENCNYKSFDRKLRLSSGSVKIPAHKTKTIKFYVRGSVTWYKMSQYTIVYKFGYDNKMYTGHFWYDGSVYKKGKKWYTTYWKENDPYNDYDDDDYDDDDYDDDDYDDDDYDDI